MKILNCRSGLLSLCVLLVPALASAQQLKLGAAPAVIEKSALLELNSDKQGLLLPRVSNYTVAPLSTAPDGMLIYYVPDKTLYVRKNGVWRKLIDETNSITSVNGQTGPAVTLTTNNISESVNLYYTDTRARAAFSAGTGINLTAGGVISALNTSALWNASQLQGRNVSNAAPANNDVLTWDNGSGAWIPKAPTTGSVGSVTSVGLSMPAIFTVTNSPVTSSGTLTATFNNQPQNQVFAAPTWGTGAPSFRTLEGSDIPNLDAAKITSGVLPYQRGGTGLNYLGTAKDVLRVKADGSGIEWSNDYLALTSTPNFSGDITATGNFYSVNTSLVNVGTAGTYTKVTTDAKGRVTYGTTLAAGDIPNLDASKIDNGVFPIARGGLGLNYFGSAGQSIRVNPAGNGFEYYNPAASSTTITLTGDATGSGTNSIPVTLANSGVTAGTYTKVTVDAKGRVTTGSALAAADLPSGSTNYIQNISTGTQTASYAISGNGSVGGNFSLPSMTTGSILFAGASGLLSQKNANLFWDNTNNRLGVGTNSPSNTLEVGGTVAGTGVSGLRLKDLNAATVQAYNSKVLSINNNGDVIVTQNAAANNWLITGNSGVNSANQFLGTTDDNKMVIRSNNQPLLEFGRRATLGLTEGYTDYTDNDEMVTYMRSALQFSVPASVSFYKPKMWTTADGNFRMKGSSAGTDYFEFGATGTNNGGGFEFVIGDDGDEPIVFKSYNFTVPAFTEIMRMQNGNVGIGLAGATPVKRLHINANNDVLRVTNLDTGTGAPLVIASNGDVSKGTSINGVSVGATTPASGAFTTLSVSTGALTLSNNTNNNINVGTASFIRITGPTGAFSVTGIAGGTEGRMITLYNATGQNMSIMNDVTSTTANRIYTTAGTVTTSGQGSFTLIYSDTDSRWILTSYIL
jgi:trimeric autotransporter adhesin